MEYNLEDEVSEFLWDPIGIEGQQDNDRLDKEALATRTSRKLP